ncbi:hypothetical protein HYPDE_26323 [Hyphomicrobium denitrificans 1NES1]|uniref:Uncharacterized protein n=1 Tax=Hyphomicrobium denitrificans 1NES1 TaxID=670307 RepID=N0B429_9HYPH|nr:hypothetical protein HYPDE_26323 [Hyphomicrobium denitrificans 1NES1]
MRIPPTPQARRQPSAARPRNSEREARPCFVGGFVGAPGAKRNPKGETRSIGRAGFRVFVSPTGLTRRTARPMPRSRGGARLCRPTSCRQPSPRSRLHLRESKRSVWPALESTPNAGECRQFRR